MAERPQGYGMTAELEAKKNSKYDPNLDREARNWIEAVTGESYSSDSTHESLKDGVLLCKLAEKLGGFKAKINTSKMAFKQMENIGHFLDWAKSYGCHASDLFQTVDLYEDVNLPVVINAIHAVGRKAQAQGYDGPALGVKEASAQHREFSEEQLREGRNVIGLQMGTNKGASQAGMNFGLGRQIKD